MERPRLQCGEAPRTQRAQEDDEIANGFAGDLDDLQHEAEAYHQQLQPETAWAEQIVGEEQESSMPCVASRDLLPTIIALGHRLEQIRSAELERFRTRLGPAHQEAVDDLTRSILNKFLRGPVRELKAHAGAPEQPVLTQLVRRIFRVAY